MVYYHHVKKEKVVSKLNQDFITILAQIIIKSITKNFDFLGSSQTAGSYFGGPTKTLHNPQVSHLQGNGVSYMDLLQRPQEVI